MHNEPTSATLRLLAEISEKQNVEVRLYPSYLQEIADEIEQLQKKVISNEHNSVRYRWLHWPRRNHPGILASTAKIEAETEVQKWKQLAHRAFKLAVGNSVDPKIFTTFDEALEAYEAKRD